MASEERVTGESRPLYTFKTDLKRNALYQHAINVLAKIPNVPNSDLDDTQPPSSDEVIERALNLKPSAFASKDNPIIVYGEHWPELNQAPSQEFTAVFKNIPDFEGEWLDSPQPVANVYAAMKNEKCTERAHSKWNAAVRTLKPKDGLNELQFSKLKEAFGKYCSEHNLWYITWAASQPTGEGAEPNVAAGRLGDEQPVEGRPIAGNAGTTTSGRLTTPNRWLQIENQESTQPKKINIVQTGGPKAEDLLQLIKDTSRSVTEKCSEFKELLLKGVSWRVAERVFVAIGIEYIKLQNESERQIKKLQEEAKAYKDLASAAVQSNNKIAAAAALDNAHLSDTLQCLLTQAGVAKLYQPPATALLQEDEFRAEGTRNCDIGASNGEEVEGSMVTSESGPQEPPDIVVERVCVPTLLEKLVPTAEEGGSRILLPQETVEIARITVESGPWNYGTTALDKGVYFFRKDMPRLLGFSCSTQEEQDALHKKLYQPVNNTCKSKNGELESPVVESGELRDRLAEAAGYPLKSFNRGMGLIHSRSLKKAMDVVWTACQKLEQNPAPLELWKEEVVAVWVETVTSRLQESEGQVVAIKVSQVKACNPSKEAGGRKRKRDGGSSIAEPIGGTEDGGRG